MRLDFCAACGATDDLEQHELFPLCRHCGGDTEVNTVTVCRACHNKVRTGGTRRPALEVVRP